MISVDPETFELVRTIQAMKRVKGSGAGDGREGGKRELPTNADGVDPVESISDERLLNLFLLMGRTNKMEDREQAQTGTASPPVAEGVSQGNEAGDRKGANIEGMSVGGPPREFQDGVDVMLAAGGLSGSDSSSVSDTGSGEVHVAGKRKTRDARDPSGGSVPAGGSSSGDGATHVVGHVGALAATMAAQMSIDEGRGMRKEVDGEEETKTNGSGNPSGGEGGGGEMQLACRHDDKVSIAFLLRFVYLGCLNLASLVYGCLCRFVIFTVSSCVVSSSLRFHLVSFHDFGMYRTY